MKGLVLFLAVLAFSASASAQPRARRRTAPRTEAAPVAHPTPAIAPVVATPPPVVPNTTPTPAPASTPPSDTTAQHHVYVAAFVGSGFGETATNLGVSVGGRIGYAGNSDVRGTVGVVVSYHFGDTVTGYDPVVRAPFSVVLRSLYLGAEVGVEPSWKALRVRPYATIGRLSTAIGCEGAPCATVSHSLFETQAAFAMGVGLHVAVALGPAFIGVEMRSLLVPTTGADLFTLSGLAGFVAP